MVLMREIKIDLTLKGPNFLFLLCFKISVFQPEFTIKTTFFSGRFESKNDAFSVFTTYIIGYILLSLKTTCSNFES